MLKNKLFMIILMMLWCFPSHAQDYFDYNAFGRLPIAHEGRIKPLSRYAELLFKQVTGNDASDDTQATAWLAMTVFDPSSAESIAQFRVANPQVLYALGLQKGLEYYDFNTLHQAFLKNKKLIASLQHIEHPTRDEQDVLELYEHASIFEQTKDALTGVLPLRVKSDTKTPLTFSDLKKNDALRILLSEKGKTNRLFRVIPQDSEWFTPWERITNGSPGTLIVNWKKTATAYIEQDAEKWSQESGRLTTLTLNQSSDETLEFRLNTERFYHAIDPFFYSFVFYLFGLVISFASKRKILTLCTYGLLGTGIVLQSLGIVARMIILQRPPVSTLYESVLCVGLMATLLFYTFAYRQNRTAFLSLSGISGVLFYGIALSLQESRDDLKVLEAVLNTRFWLATHVMAISAGYALCALTSLSAHTHLVAKVFKTRHYFTTLEFSRRLYQFSVWALLFVAGGTLLGGVWADQSWGRFWGWDPKENGALLIVLWLTWLLHAKFSKHLSLVGFHLGLAFLGIIVGLSWLGVNLLGVGLHSYGFTNSLATGFTVFCIGDILMLGLIWLKGRKNGTFTATI